MGTTVVCALLTGTTLTIGHVGDSRLYILADGRLVAQTRDDTWAAALLEGGDEGTALRGHPMRNVLTNVLGGRPTVDVHVTERVLLGGEVLLLCSDGVHGVLDAAALARILERTPDVAAAAQAIVDTALEQGSRDNVTALVVRYEAEA